MSGNIIHQGKDTTLIPNENSKYILEVIAHSDGFKDYDTLNVNVIKQYISNIYPNPSTGSNNITIDYTLDNASTAQLILKTSSNIELRTINLSTSQSTKTINTNLLPSGNYILNLVCDGILSDSKTFTK